MKSSPIVLRTGLLVLLFLEGTFYSRAVTHYVDVYSANPVSPFTSWATAANSIQAAINACAVYDEVLVTNGVYASDEYVRYADTNRVGVEIPVTVRSVNGPQYTIIDGDGQMRCAYLTNGASLWGFTLTNGTGLFPLGGGGYISENGGGIYCESSNAFVGNCIVVSNIASSGGGIFQGTITNCVVSGNSAPNWPDNGGGAEGAILKHCTIIGNHAYNDGGGADGCRLEDCILIGNTATMGGLLAPRPLPITSYGNGGGASFSTLNNCVLIGNQAAWAGGGAFNCTLTNCVLLSNNTAAVWSSVLYNSISYYNADGNEAGCAMTNCCTTPDPGGSGNITNEPVFVDLVNGNLRLQSNSPCINAGNNAYIASATDLDGNLRIINGSVDIGAYEYQGPSGLAGFHAWLSQFGLASDGSADYADSDGDGLNNYEEWRAGTNPTNSASVLKILVLLPGATNVVIHWQSALGIGYFIQRATVMPSPAFVTLGTNLAGLGGPMTFSDTNSIADSQRYYRIGVGN